MPLPGEENLITDADVVLLGVVAATLSDVPPATIAAQRGVGIAMVLSALGKRAKRPVTWVDDDLKSAMAWMTVKLCMLWRGLSADDDAVVTAQIKEIDGWIEKVANGDVEPAFVDSTPAIDEMGSLSGSSATSDAWARAGCAARRCRL